MACKTALVVGGTSGIGHGIALHLAKLGVNVTIAGRSLEKGNEIIEEMKKISPSNEFGFVKINGFQLDSVKSVASEVMSLDYLVLTMGMATTQGYTETENHLDQKLQLHYYARVLLALKLASVLEKSEDPRVLSVLSAGVHSPYMNYEQDPTLKNSYSVKNAADAAGFYTDIALDKLAEENPKINFTHAAPGFVNTSWGTEMNFFLRGIIRMAQTFGKSKEKCGQILVDSWLKLKPGLNLINENGNKIDKLTNEHNKAKDIVWKHTQEALQLWL